MVDYMSISSERVKSWRRRMKQKLVEGLGGKCCMCGYNRCLDALALHHKDPTQKEFSFSRFRANPKSWEKVIPEVKKCALLCHNCHSEVHAGLTELPEDVQEFDVTLISSHGSDMYVYNKSETKMSKRKSKSNPARNIKPTLQIIKEPCPICGNLKWMSRKTCSRKCAANLPRKIDWGSVDLEIELKTKSMCQIGRELGCSDNAVRKRAKKLGLLKPKE